MHTYTVRNESSMDVLRSASARKLPTKFHCTNIYVRGMEHVLNGWFRETIFGDCFRPNFIVPTSTYTVWNTSSMDGSKKQFLRDVSDQNFAVPASTYAVSRSESSMDTPAK